MQIVPATQHLNECYGLGLCIMLEPGDHPDPLEIASLAVMNQAWVDNSGEEAGDDLYAVQFPGEEQMLLGEDALQGYLRGMRAAQA